MRIAIVNQFFYPDTSATSQLLTDLAVDLVAMGHEVSVVAGNAYYQGGDLELKRRENYRGVSIYRVYCGRFDRKSPMRRVVSYARFLLGAALRIFRRTAPDVVMVLTTPPLVALLPALLHTARGIPFVCWVQDVYPDLAVALGAISPHSTSARLADGLNGYIFAAAAGVVALGDCMRDLLLCKGVAPGKIQVIHNWSDGEIIYPVPRAQNSFARGLGIHGDFVACYSGNLGLGHEFETMLEAMRQLDSVPGIRFLIIGGGARQQEFEQRCQESQLGNVLFLPHQPRKNLAMSLSVGDVGLVSMRDGLSGTMVASKIYGLMAAGRPYIFIGPEDTTMARLASRYHCGWRIAPGDAASLADMLMTLQRNSQLAATAGLNARRVFDAHFTRRHAIESFERVLLAAVRHPAARPVHYSASAATPAAPPE